MPVRAVVSVLLLGEFVHYLINLPFWHVTQGEAWYAVIALLAGLLVGVHMAQPRYARRD